MSEDINLRNGICCEGDYATFRALIEDHDELGRWLKQRTTDLIRVCDALDGIVPTIKNGDEARDFLASAVVGCVIRYYGVFHVVKDHGPPIGKRLHALTIENHDNLKPKLKRVQP